MTVEAEAVTEDDQAEARAPGRRRLDRGRLVALAVGAVAAVPRSVTAADGIETTGDWLLRSAGFADAVTSADFSRASATEHSFSGVATMPGVTLMWIGSAARGLWRFGQDVGLWAEVPGAPGATYVTSRSGLILSHTLYALVTSVLVGVLALLVARWAGWRAAAVAGTIIATEPFLVAHGALFFTDDLMTLFGLCALVATALVLGLPHRTTWTGRRWAALVAGGLWGASLLSKLAALMLLPPVALLGAWAVVVAVRRRPDGVSPWSAVRPMARLGASWLTAAVVVFVVAYPAMWVDPLSELQALQDSADIASWGQLQYFRGEPTATPGPAYYFVALPLRVTPWFLLAAPVAAVVVGWRPATRPFGLALACMAVPPLVTTSFASSQFDRYGLPLLDLAAVAVGIAAVALVDRGGFRPRIVAGTGLALGAAVFVHALAVAPWGIGYFNPALGGAATGERTILVSSNGETPVGTDESIRTHARGRCERVTLYGGLGLRDVTCGRAARDDEVPTYVVIHVFERQRMADETRDRLVGERRLVGEVTARGITYVEVFGPAPGGETMDELPSPISLFGLESAEDLPG